MPIPKPSFVIQQCILSLSTTERYGTAGAVCVGGPTNRSNAAGYFPAPAFPTLMSAWNASRQGHAGLLSRCDCVPRESGGSSCVATLVSAPGAGPDCTASCTNMRRPWMCSRNDSPKSPPGDLTIPVRATAGKPISIPARRARAASGPLCLPRFRTPDPATPTCEPLRYTDLLKNRRECATEANTEEGELGFGACRKNRRKLLHWKELTGELGFEPSCRPSASRCSDPGLTLEDTL